MTKDLTPLISKLASVKTEKTGIPFEYWESLYKMRYDFDKESIRLRQQLEESSIENSYLQELVEAIDLETDTERKPVGFHNK